MCTLGRNTAKFCNQAIKLYILSVWYLTLNHVVRGLNDQKAERQKVQWYICAPRSDAWQWQGKELETSFPVGPGIFQT